MQTWEKLVKAGNEHDLALYIGTETLRIRKLAEVRLYQVPHKRLITQYTACVLLRGLVCEDCSSRSE